jgi:GNAT superfamily N-acetyltransferase
METNYEFQNFPPALQAEDAFYRSLEVESTKALQSQSMPVPLPVPVKAGPGDGQHLGKIAHEAGQVFVNIGAIPEGTWNFFAKNTLPTVLEDDIGTGQAQIFKTEGKQGPIGFVNFNGDTINILHVTPKKQGNRHGTALMNQAETIMREAGYNTATVSVLTNNKQAKDFYFKRGYSGTEETTSEFPPGTGNFITEIRLFKQLG